MALTVSMLGRGHIGPIKANVVQVTFDSSYPAGGEALAANELGLDQVIEVFEGSGFNATADTAISVKYDKAAAKLQAFRIEQVTHRTGSTTAADSTTGSLLENASDAEGAFRAMGTAIDTDLVLSAKDPFFEVLATTDLSSFKVVLLAIGH